MLKAILARFRQGHCTMAYPDAPPPPLPPRFRGLPILNATLCADGCQACVESCPYGALSADGTLSLDMGKCLFCGDCRDVCPQGAFTFSTDACLSSRTRQGLTISSGETY